MKTEIKRLDYIRLGDVCVMLCGGTDRERAAIRKRIAIVIADMIRSELQREGAR